MNQDRASQVLLGYKFIKSYTFKGWRVISKIKKLTNPKWYHKYLETTKKYTHFSPEWIKQVIVPSKAFHYWLNLNEFFDNFKKSVHKAGKKYLPSHVKALLKKHLPAFYVLDSTSVSSIISNDWVKWVEKRENKSLDIIDFCVIAYAYRIQRPQHLASELTKLGHRVFYIENEFCFAGSSRHPQLKVSKTMENLYTIKLSSSKNYFIYSDQPSYKDKKIIIASLKKLLREARILNPIAKIDHPFWASIANELGMPIVYDIMDLHSGFKENSTANINNENELIAKSNLILASSSYLERKFKFASNKIILLKNAGDYFHFSNAAKNSKKLTIPKDMIDIPGPILGYYGALADWFDVKLIAGLAENLPTCSIVLVGLVSNKEIERLTHDHPNIYLLGEKPYSQLPNYLQMFDVCLIPFKLTELIKATNPVKIYEYFSAGKPVVSTSIPELLPYKQQLYLADDVQSFTKEVKKALVENNSELILSRQKVAKQNTWTHRAKTLEQSLLRLYPKVSIIVLVYNQPELSKITIDSVLSRSKYPSFEVIVVDNKSNSETKTMLRKYRSSSSLKVIWNSKNYGFAGGNNIGLHKANGDYLVLLNNDVRVTPGWLERLIYHYQFNDKNPGLLGPVTNSIGNEAKINIGYDPDNQKELEEQSADYTYSHWGESRKLKNIAAFAWIKSKKVFKLIGDFDERFGRGLFEDDDYCLRIRAKGLDISYAEDSFVHHYGGASMKWNTKEYLELFEENKLKFEHKWGVKWTPHKNRKK